MNRLERAEQIRRKYQRLREEKERQERELEQKKQTDRIHKSERIKQKQKPETKLIELPKKLPANCKYCGKEILITNRTKNPVCKDQKCRRAYGVDRVMLCRQRRREREQMENESKEG